MTDKVKGVLEVGISGDGREVIINHPDLQPDADGVGHIVFSPEQARNLAKLLTGKADEIEGRTQPSAWAGSGNYVADDAIYPTRIEFANGRIVAVKHEGSKIFLGIA